MLPFDNLKKNLDPAPYQNHSLRNGMEFCLSSNSEFILGFYPKDDDSACLNAWNLKSGMDSEIPITNSVVLKNNNALEHADKNDKWISSLDNCHLKFNPSFMMLATSYNNILTLWQPLL